MSDQAPISLPGVREFYDSDVVITRFNRCFAGAWHTAVRLGLPGMPTAEQYLCHLLDLGRDHELLDFGSGVGVTSCRIAQQTGCQARGLNISARQVGTGNELARQLGLAERVRFDLYPGREFPYDDSSFDRALFFESPCHVPHKQLLFEELFRVLKPSGACAGQDWMLAVDDISNDDYERYIRPIEVAVEVALLSCQGYRDLMARAGFSNIRTIDARDIAPGLPGSFSKPSSQPIKVSRHESLAQRLDKGDSALSTAFAKGLFTIGLVYGEKPGPGSERQPSQGDSASRLVPTEEQGVAIFARRKNLAWVDFHRSAFEVPQSAPLAAFSRLIAASACCTVESSIKVESGRRHCARWNLFCHGEHQELFLASVLGFFDEVSVSGNLALDYSLIHQFQEAGIDFSRVRKVVTGIDLRRDWASSRLKLWFMLTDAPELVERAIKLHGDPGAIAALRVHAEFLVGFDLGFDGRSAIKLYPDLLPEELADPATRQRVGTVLSDQSERALTAMSECVWTHVYIARHNSDPVLQFHPADPDDFVARYLPASARQPHRVYDGVRLLDMVVSIPAGELGRAAVNNFALYYMPETAPGGSQWS